jgi:hypothetical protein
MKPKLKPPGTKRLKVKCDILMSTSAFKFNLRRYNEEEEEELLAVAACGDIAVSAAGSEAAATVAGEGCGASDSFYGSDQRLAGLGGDIAAAAGSGQCRSCPLVSSETVYWVRRCMFPLSTPR